MTLSNGVPTLSVTRGGTTVLEPGPLGVVTERADLSTGLRLTGRTERRVVEHYTASSGKQRQRTVVHKEERYSFAGAARLDLVVRTAADGVAYRYELPAGLGNVLRETSAFHIPAAATAWIAKYRRDYENPFVQTNAAAAETADYLHPALFETNGVYSLLTESSVDGRHSGAHLSHTAGSGVYSVKYWDEQVRGGRTVAVAVAHRCRRFAGGRVGVDPRGRPGAPVEGARHVVDQARQGVLELARGWPRGRPEPRDAEAVRGLRGGSTGGRTRWSTRAGTSTRTGTTTRRGRQTSWIPSLVSYAAARGVKIHLWVHYDELDTAAESAARLALFERWGIAGVKIDFMDSDGQDRYRWYDRILAETAAHRLLVNFHGSTIPHGIHRTWPHVMTMEAVHGGEKSSGLTGQHLTALPFTRGVVGGMDYTPLAWHRPSRTTSDAHELALTVIYESGLANLAGRPEDYAARPVAERFVDQVPTAWDETRLLSGRPADHSVFARRSRRPVVHRRWVLRCRTDRVSAFLPAFRALAGGDHPGRSCGARARVTDRARRGHADVGRGSQRRFRRHRLPGRVFHV